MKIFQILFFLLLVLFPFGQLGRLPLGNGEITLQLNDLAVGALVGGWFWGHLVKRKKIVLPPLSKPIIFFSAFAILSFLINLKAVGMDSAAFLYLLRWIFYAGLYFFVFEMVKEKKIKQKWAIGGLIYAGITVGIFGILQYFLYPNLRNLFYLGWDPHYFRVFSTFFDPAFTGIILVLTLILLVVSKRRWWFWGAVAIVYIAMALTYSRSSYLAFITGMGVIAYLKRAPKFFLVVILIFVITLVVLPKREDRIGSDLARQDSALARIINWKQSFEIIKDYPIFGVGFNNYRQVQERYGFLKKEEWLSHAAAGADSSLLFVWTTTGIFGLLAYLWLGWRILNLGLNSWYRKKSIYGLVLSSSVIALFFHSFFANSLFYPWIMEWVWILAAMISVEKSVRESK